MLKAEPLTPYEKAAQKAIEACNCIPYDETFIRIIGSHMKELVQFVYVHTRMGKNVPDMMDDYK